jgi:hypothetical protein
MAMYRFYTIRKDGHVAGPPIDYDAARDPEAIAHAKQLQDGHDIEIWQEARLVAYLVTEHPTDAAQ